jgi:hypothetical protein
MAFMDLFSRNRAARGRPLCLLSPSIEDGQRAKIVVIGSRSFFSSAWQATVVIPIVSRK